MIKVIILLMTCQLALAAPDQCDEALSACLAVVEAQDQQIAGLESHLRLLEQKLVESTEREPTVPTWVWVVGGMLIGATATKIIR